MPEATEAASAGPSVSDILVVAPAWIGDAVLSQPMLALLGERFPDSHIDVLAAPWVAPVFERMAQVRQVIVSPFGHGELRLAGRRRLAETLPPYARAIVLPNSLKSALVPWFAGIPVRTGWRGEMRFGLLNDLRELDEMVYPLLTERFAALAMPAHVSLGRVVPRPRLDVDPEARAATLARLGLSTEAPVLALAPGAEYGPAKRWPTRHFAGVARAYAARGFQTWLFGSANDANVAAEVAESTNGRAANLAGRTSLAQAIDLLSLADRVVTNDSGLMHIAAALGRPLAAVFGSSSPGFTPPLSASARIISRDLPCSPCFQRTCPLGHGDCLEKLEPARVISALDRIRRPRAEREAA